MPTHTKQFLISVAPVTRIALTRDQSFFYTFSRPLPVGTLVEIPVGKRFLTGIVTKSTADIPRRSAFTIKKIRVVIAESFLTERQVALAYFISAYYMTALGVVLKYFIHDETRTRTQPPTHTTATKNIATTPNQNRIVDTLFTQKKAHILHSTDQNDKITILFSLMKRHSAQNRQSLYILPELLQTPYIMQFLTQFFTHDDVALIHGKLAKGQLWRNWSRIASGKAKIIIGTRSAIFAPFTDLGTIIVDESHDAAHKQWDTMPFYDVRTLARHMHTLYNCSVVLASATPRVVDMHTTPCIQRTTKRHARITIVDMKKERWDKHFSPLSRTLITALKQCLAKKQQAILFVNRQGMSAFSVCTKCRSVVKCPQCDRALVATHAKNYICLHCHTKTPLTKTCNACRARIEHIGIGTQNISTELRKLFPHARIAIADASTMKKSTAHDTMYYDFLHKKIDIIIGTQMITKQWYTHAVGLAAIIDADHLLQLPDYTTNERAFAFVAQMALRTTAGTLLVQTFDERNPVLLHAQKYDFASFYKDELRVRNMLHYPPYTRVIKILYQDVTKKRVSQKINTAYDTLCTIAATHDGVITVSEPHAPLLDKIRTKYRTQIILKIHAKDIPQDIRAFLVTLDTKWLIDIDPVQII